MQKLNYKVHDDTWSPTTPYVRVPRSAVVNGQVVTDANGRWVPAKGLWRKTSTGWVSVETVDTVVGVAPTVSASVNISTGMLDINAINKDTRSQSITILVSTSAYPTTATQTSNLVMNQTNAAVATGKSFVQSIKVTAGLTYYVSVWGVPANKLSSTRVTASVKATKSTPTPPTVFTNTVTLIPTDARTYRRATGYHDWLPTSDIWQSGNPANEGLWFYGTGLSQLMRYCSKINSTQITVQRHSGAYGVSGAAEVWLCYHKLASKPAGAPDYYGMSYAGTLTRGQVKSFNIPTEWYPGMMNGTIKGFGLYYAATSATDPKYLRSYGRGTVSGQVKITAQYTRAPRVTLSGGSQVISFN